VSDREKRGEEVTTGGAEVPPDPGPGASSASNPWEQFFGPSRDKLFAYETTASGGIFQDLLERRKAGASGRKEKPGDKDASHGPKQPDPGQKPQAGSHPSGKSGASSDSFSFDTASVAPPPPPTSGPPPKPGAGKGGGEPKQRFAWSRYPRLGPVLTGVLTLIFIGCLALFGDHRQGGKETGPVPFAPIRASAASAGMRPIEVETGSDDSQLFEEAESIIDRETLIQAARRELPAFDGLEAPGILPDVERERLKEVINSRRREGPRR
jgi:hypothetical protein